MKIDETLNNRIFLRLKAFIRKQFLKPVDSETRVHGKLA